MAENIFLGRHPLRNGRVDRARMAEEAAHWLSVLGVEVDPRRAVKGLSMSVQHGVEIAKAISRRPRYVTFDEPTASVGAEEARPIVEQIRLLTANRTGVVYVSHRLEEIQEIADEATYPRDGVPVACWDDGRCTNSRGPNRGTQSKAPLSSTPMTGRSSTRARL